VRVQITPAGLRKLDAVLTDHLAVERRLLAALGAPQQRQLIKPAPPPADRSRRRRADRIAAKPGA